MEEEGKGLAVRVRNLTVKFGGLLALKDLDMDVQPAEIYGIVGRNGAGKSTLIDVLSGMVNPSGGDVEVLGMNPIKNARKLRTRIGVVPQETSLELKLSGRENLEYFGRLLDVPRSELDSKVEDMLHFTSLWERRDDPVEQYSGGMKKRIHFACSMIHSPGLILIDEATAGFDPVAKRDTLDMILRMNRDMGLTVVLTTHDLKEATVLCDRLGVLHRGHLVVQGSWKEIKSHYKQPLILEGLSERERNIVRETLESKRLRERSRGFEISVRSREDGLEVIRILEEKGARPSSISFGIDPERLLDIMENRGGEED